MIARGRVAPVQLETRGYWTLRRIVVTGGRQYFDKRRVWGWLDALAPLRVAAGDAFGADALALEWAQDRGVSWKRYSADWDRFGLAAGPKRNAAMLAEERPDLLLAFPGGRGTKSCTDIALSAEMIHVIQVHEHGGYTYTPALPF